MFGKVALQSKLCHLDPNPDWKGPTRRAPKSNNCSPWQSCPVNKYLRLKQTLSNHSAVFALLYTFKCIGCSEYENDTTTSS